MVKNECNIPDNSNHHHNHNNVFPAVKYAALCGCHVGIKGSFLLFYYYCVTSNSLGTVAQKLFLLVITILAV